MLFLNFDWLVLEVNQVRVLKFALVLDGKTLQNLTPHQIFCSLSLIKKLGFRLFSSSIGELQVLKVHERFDQVNVS